VKAIEFTLTQHIAAAPDRVFHALTDLDSAADWMPGFVRIENLSQGEFSVGSQWRETRKFFGKEATEQFEVTRCESPTELSVRVDGSKGSSRRGEYLFDYRLEPKGAGTDVTLHAAIRGTRRPAPRTSARWPSTSKAQASRASLSWLVCGVFISLRLLRRSNEDREAATAGLCTDSHRVDGCTSLHSAGGATHLLAVELLGIIPLAVGIVINVVADRAFRRAGTTVKPFQESSALIMTGVFRLSRNPMYLGFVLVVLGIAVITGSLTPLVVVPAFALLLDRNFIAAEERMLEERFGSVWLEYKKSVRRWI
jgi:protein-S-isoprenylcysteine O-methyltransferase Ste14